MTMNEYLALTIKDLEAMTLQQLKALYLQYNSPLLLNRRPKISKKLLIENLYEAITDKKRAIALNNKLQWCR